MVTKFDEDAQVTSDFESRDSDQDQSYYTVIEVSFRKLRNSDPTPSPQGKQATARPDNHRPESQPRLVSGGRGRTGPDSEGLWAGSLARTASKTPASRVALMRVCACQGAQVLQAVLARLPARRSLRPFIQPCGARAAGRTNRQELLGGTGSVPGGEVGRGREGGVGGGESLRASHNS